MTYTPQGWDERVQRLGHTGWANDLVYAHDQPLRLQAVLRAVRRYSNRHMSVVDIGCGVGDFAAAMVDEGAQHVLAFDVSKEAIAVALSTHGAKRGQVSFQTGDARLQTLPHGSSDLALSITVLQHMDDSDVANVLHRVSGWLRPGGLLIALEARSVRGVTSRSIAAYDELADKAGLELVAANSYPQWGVSLLTHLARGSAAGAASIGRQSRMRRLATWAVLKTAYVPDRLLEVSTPIGWSPYRILVFRRRNETSAD